MRGVLALICALTFGVACSGGGVPSAVGSRPADSSVASVGSSAPRFELPLASGGSFSFPQDLKGAPGLLYFSMGPG